MTYHILKRQPKIKRDAPQVVMLAYTVGDVLDYAQREIADPRVLTDEDRAEILNRFDRVDDYGVCDIIRKITLDVLRKGDEAARARV